MTDEKIPTADTIQKSVQERYGAIASGFNPAQNVDPELTIFSSAAATDNSECCSADLYDADTLDGLPFDVTGLSLGCGDPVTIAGLQPGETVLDLGSGGGIDCFLAGRQVGETGTVIGVDMTPAMLQKANANRDKLGMHNVSFRAGRIEDLPVESSTIDVVMSNCVINLVPDKLAVLREAFRVLKPGGRLSISDIVAGGEFTPEQRANLEAWSACSSGAIEEDAYIALLEEAGFTTIAVTDKRDATDIVLHEQGMPRVFSARITATKPTA